MTQTPIYASFRDWPPGSWHWPSFTAAEMSCKGDGSLMLDLEAMDRLQALRLHLGTPFVIFSAYRSPAHNAAVGGAPHSQHMQGRAFDISMRGHDPKAFAGAARAMGFHGIGHYPEQGFMHIDARPDIANWTIPQGASWPDASRVQPGFYGVLHALDAVAQQAARQKPGTTLQAKQRAARAAV